jgi:putative chitinase
MVVEKNQKD